jgi:methionine-gamma-lyase
VVDAANRDASGVHERLVRISVGLEHVEDLWNDLENALGVATAVTEDAAGMREATQAAASGS